MDASIIIVNWNTKDLLQRCLTSLYKSVKNVTFEVIVVDNGSLDNSPEMVEKNFGKVKLVKNNDNLGFAKGCNIGIKNSKGRYLFFINSDITEFNDSIQKSVDFMDTNNKIGLLGAQVLNENGRIRYTCRRKPNILVTASRAFGLDKIFTICHSHFGEEFHKKSQTVPVLAGCFWAVRRTAMDDVGLLDELFFIYCEDDDWSKRFCNAGWKVFYFTEAKVTHIGGGSSKKDPIRFFIEGQKASIQYWKKHHQNTGKFSQLFVLSLYNINRLIAWGLIFLMPHPKRNSSKLMIKKYSKAIKWLFHAGIRI